MDQISLKSLVGRLNDLCRRTLEAVNRHPVRSLPDLVGAMRGGSGVLSLTVVDPQLGRMIINYSLTPGS